MRNAGEPRTDRPLPLWTIFPLLFIAVYGLHITLLRLPYYWDEAGYYIPAAYDFFRTGSVIPYSTLPNAHPPLLSLYLALWWKASGFIAATTRVAMCLIAAVALLGVFRLSLLLSGRTQVAVTTTILTMIYPVWFAQSTLAHADLLAAAATLWGLVYAFTWLAAPEERIFRWRTASAAALWFSVAALSKETSIVTPAAMALCVGYGALHNSEQRRRRAAFAAWLLVPVLPLAAWYAFYWRRTGYIFGNPQFLHYNATSNFTPLRILLALAHRVLQLTADMNMFVPVLSALGALLLIPRLERDGSERPRIPLDAQAILYTVLAANLLFYSVAGGALLTRYLLPLYPLVLLLCVATWRRRVPFWGILAGLAAGAFILGLLLNPPYRFAPEDNLGYASMIRLHQQAVWKIQRDFAGGAVLTAWPATDELSKPELGYVRKPIPVVAIQNFSLAQVQSAAASPKSFTSVFAFSTKYNPPRAFLGLGWRNEAWDARYFGFYRELRPGKIAGILHGIVVWRAERNGQWAAIIQANHLRGDGSTSARQHRLSCGPAG